jgi:hemerythrin-like domain-containing protein
MKQDIQLLAEALEEAYKALAQGDKDIALACIAYAQTIINGTHREQP